jgi:hypothetical protein
MGKQKTLQERLFGAAVLKASFRLRGEEGSAPFRAIFLGVLRDLSLTEAEVDRYLETHRDEVEAAARGKG